MDEETGTPFSIVQGELPTYVCAFEEMDRPVIGWGEETDAGWFYRRMLVDRPKMSRMDREDLDDGIRDRFFSRAYVVMLGFDWGTETNVAGLHKAVEVCHPVAQARGGVAIEEFIFAFKDAASAFDAALVIKSQLEGPA